jgi:hypothetical protein
MRPTRPTSLRTLYRRATGDMVKDEMTIAAGMESFLDERQRQIIEWRVEGWTFREISELDSADLPGGKPVNPGTLSAYVKHAFGLIQEGGAPMPVGAPGR